MKTFLLSILSVTMGLLLQAQGIYNMWGITGSGGSEGWGVIYKTDGAGNHFQVQHHFSMTAPGAQPRFSQLVDYQNKFYGMTLTGETLAGGNIFEWDPATNICINKVNLTFAVPNGYHPYGSLCLVNNKFYGMTAEGGINNAGVIFEWDPATNVFTKKIDLADSSGSHPQGDLLYYNGYLYGSTPEGGAYGAGVLFKWNPASNVYQKILDFDMENGDYTNGQMLLLNGKIYGLTRGLGMGAIFQIDPQTDQFSRKFQFTLYETGDVPTGNMIADRGKIYGFHNDPYVDENGSSTNRQAIFEWDPVTGVLTNKVYFDSISLNASGANIIVAGNKFYGAADNFSEDGGSLFEWDPAANTTKKLFEFNQPNNSGIHPSTPLAFKDGILYGMTAAGGVNGWDESIHGLGVIYQWDIASSTYTKRLDLAGGIVNRGMAGLCYYKGKLYGRTMSSFSGGTIFELDPLTNIYQEKTMFENGFRDNPTGNMVAFHDKLYGLCGGGGAKGYGGEIFEYDPLTNVYLDARAFGSPDRYGYSPLSYLTLYNNILYGSNRMGGVNEDGSAASLGVFFSFDPVSRMYGGVNGMQPPEVPLPTNGLTSFENKLYGGTRSGGANDQGLLFEWNPADNSYVKKIDLTETDGILPGEMTLYKNKLYGTTRFGGSTNSGVLFEWDPIANVYTKKRDLTVADGSLPYGSMITNNGKLYGTTWYGGDAGAGVLFEWDPIANVYTKKKDFGGADGAAPSGSLTLVPAPVAAGAAGICTVLPAININSSNNQQWIAITDEEGNAVAEINAHGNNLGTVTPRLFINSGAIRKTANQQPYLDRNISLTAQVQPGTPVSIRLYITSDEYNRLKTAASQYAAGAINNKTDLRIYRAGDGCVSTIAALNSASAGSAEAWENDLVLSTTVNQLGNFFIAGKEICSAPLINNLIANPAVIWPPNHQLKNVTVNYKVTTACPPVSVWLTVSSNEKPSGGADWVITNGHLVQLRAERQGNGSGRVYTIMVHATDAAGNSSMQSTTVTVPHSNGMQLKGNTGMDADANQELHCIAVPNPSHNNFTLQVQAGTGEKMELTLSDISGRLLNKWMATGASQFGDELLPGIYLLTVKQGEQQVLIKLVKQ